MDPEANCSWRARRVLAVSAVPPPLHVLAVMTASVLDAVFDTGWDVVHVDTLDHYSTDGVGRLVTTRHASSASSTSPASEATWWGLTSEFMPVGWRRRPPHEFHR